MFGQRRLWRDKQHETGETRNPRQQRKKENSTHSILYLSPFRMQFQGCTNTLKSFFANVDILRYAIILTECKLLLEKQKFDDCNKRNLKDDKHSGYLNTDKIEYCPNECCQVGMHS